MPALVIGSGYLGGYIKRLFPDTIHTSRNPEGKNESSSYVRLDPDDISTWNNLSELNFNGAVITFDAASSERFIEFVQLILALTPRVVIIGTTSAFSAGNGIITDYSPVNGSNPRTMKEESARLHGASVLHSAGIYGYGRNPLDWIRKGYIKNPYKKVNLIHAGDLARSVMFLLNNFISGERFVISDGRPQLWKDIAAFAVKKGFPDVNQFAEILNAANNYEEMSRAAETGVTVKPAKLFDAGFKLLHSDLYRELEVLEGFSDPLEYGVDKGGQG